MKPVIYFLTAFIQKSPRKTFFTKGSFRFSVFLSLYSFVPTSHKFPQDNFYVLLLNISKCKKYENCYSQHNKSPNKSSADIHNGQFVHIASLTYGYDSAAFSLENFRCGQDCQ